MSWNCPMCKQENTTGREACSACGTDFKRLPPPEVEEEEKLTEVEIQQLMAIGDRFGSLITGKGLSDVVKPGEFVQATALFLESSAMKIQQGKTDLLTGLLVAIAWGIYVAESGSSKLSEDLTKLH